MLAPTVPSRLLKLPFAARVIRKSCGRSLPASRFVIPCTWSKNSLLFSLGDATRNRETRQSTDACAATSKQDRPKLWENSLQPGNSAELVVHFGHHTAREK